MNQITDYLWIADISAVREQSVPTDVVVSVCQDRVDDNIGCRYEFFNMADGEVSEGLHGARCDYELFEDAVDTVVDYVDDGNSVLVHCHAGISRSGAVSIATVATIEEIPIWEAYNVVKDARQMVNPVEILHEHARQYVRENGTSTRDT